MLTNTPMTADVANNASITCKYLHRVTKLGSHQKQITGYQILMIMTTRFFYSLHKSLYNLIQDQYK